MICKLECFTLCLPYSGKIGKHNKSLLGINDYIFNRVWKKYDIDKVVESIKYSSNYFSLSIESGTVTIHGELHTYYRNNYLEITALDNENTVIKWQGKYRGLLEGKSLFGNFTTRVKLVSESTLGTDLSYEEYKSRRKGLLTLCQH